jgi:hypothetical protein
VAATESEETFSLVAGGPLYQLYRRAHLSDPELELLKRRVLVITLLAWLPLLVLSLVDGYTWGGVKLSFVKDIEAQVRMLVALPLLLAAELSVHYRMRAFANEFLIRGIVTTETRSRFDAAVDSALRWRNSTIPEVVLIAIVYSLGVSVFWRRALALDAATWYRQTVGGSVRLTLAGLWYVLVALPIFQFILYRWYFRLIIWARFMWQVSRIDLKLAAAHPDQAGGLGFIGDLYYAFAPLLLAQGALFAALMAEGIWFRGMTLPQYAFQLAGLVALALAVVLGPLLTFVPILLRTRRQGLLTYGAFAQRYVSEFHRKWVLGQAPPEEPLLGSADIQSLADLGNSYHMVRDMRLFPIGGWAIALLALVTLAPIAPLVLTVIPLKQLIAQILQAVF